MNDNKDLRTVVNAAIGNDEAREMGYLGIGVARLADNEDVYVIFKDDEYIEVEGRGPEVDIEGYQFVSLPDLSDEVLISPSITDKEWSLLCELFGGCDE